MKTKLYILTSLLFSISLLLNGQSNKNFDTYGQSFDIAGINNYKVEKESLLNNPQDDTKLVYMSDEGKNRCYLINGKLSVDTLSVAQLRHYAEDAGKSNEEVSKIIKPEITISFLADGVVIDK